MEIKTLTIHNIREVVNNIRKSDDFGTPLFWVENRYWYKSEDARIVGFDCTDEELDIAEKDKRGFIKSSQGIELYLTKYLNGTAITTKKN